MKKTLLYIFICLSNYLVAQVTIYSGAKIHIGNGQVIENGVLVVKGQQIVDIGNNLQEMESKWTVEEKVEKQVPSKDPATKVVTSYFQAEKPKIVLLQNSQEIYPGFIAPNCYSGLNEIDAARPTKDFNEVGLYNPNVRTLTSYNTDSKILPTLAFNGILAVQASPFGGVVCGSSSVLSTKADNWEDASIYTDDGIYINWQEVVQPMNEEQTKNHKEFLEGLDKFFSEAKAYIQLQQVGEKNLKYESMRGLWQAEKRLYIRVNSAYGMLEAIAFAESKNIKNIVLVGAIESYKICDKLREKHIPIILMNVHRLPSGTDEDVLLPYKLPKILLDSGIQFCLGLGGSWEVRNLAFQAGTAAAYGLTKEQALASITKNTAAILGCEQQLGTIEKGKQATFFICNGDALDMKSNILYKAFIKGIEINLQGQQQELYKKYQKKYFGE